MKKQKIDLLITDAAELVTLAGPPGPRTGKDMDELAIIERGAVAVKRGRIIETGPSRSLVKKYAPKRSISARGKCVMPGFVDPHTHAVFAKTREHEFEMRLRGATYVEITKAGGGIHSSVRATRKATLKALIENGRKQLDEMLAHGTTTAEIKSGYALTTSGELKMLRAIKALAETHPMDIAATFLGAHEVPAEYRKKKNEYIRILVEEMLPRVAKEKLAEFCDIFTEAHVYNIAESRRILNAAKRLGFKIKIHADEIEPLGGAQLAAELGAVSADHLVQASAAGIRAMKKAGVIPVLLPGTTFSLRGRKYAPARRMIKAGLPVALSTDLNPGTCMCHSMQEIISIACLKMSLTPAEALTAATVNAAHAIDRGGDAGSLESGKKADVLILKVPSYRSLPYELGANLVDMVIKNGAWDM
jgi:imidazolonepropionase